jgi:glycosyltransferase involved in cell wall biosynthesis
MSTRITFVGPVSPLCSGIAQHGGFLTEALSKRADVTVLSWQHQYPKLLFRHAQRDDNAVAHPTARFDLRWWDPLSWLRAGRTARKGDVLVLTWTTPFHALPYRVMLWSARRTRRVAVVHNAVPHERLPLQRPLTRWVLGRCDGLVDHASTVADEVALLDLDVEAVTTPMPPLIEVVPQPLPEADALRLLFFGFVRPYKGLADALDALVLLSEQGARPRLSVVGEFWADVDPWHQRIAELGLDDQVELRPGYVPDAAVSGLFADHHAVLLPYRSASQSGIVPIAMAAGRPVIATAVGGIVEAVTDGVNGTLAEPGNPKSLADAISRCAARLPELAARTRDDIPTWDDVALVVLKVAGVDAAHRSRPGDPR